MALTGNVCWLWRTELSPSAQPVSPGISFPDFVQNASSTAYLSCVSLWVVPVLPCEGSRVEEKKFCLTKTCMKSSTNPTPLAPAGFKHVLVVNQVFKWFSDLASLRGDIPEEKEESRAVASQL